MAAQVTSSKPIVIIGAGLAGLFLSISLNAKSLPCTVYELRSRDTNHGGAIMLSPNSLRILDQMGIYDRIRTKGYNFETLSMKNDENQPIGTYFFGSKKLFGYEALRIYRQVLIDELVAIAEERGVKIVFEKKYEQIVEETEEGVKVAFADGEVVDASFVVGTDGIHSKVRQYVAPGTKPTYLDQMSVCSAVKTKDIRFPAGDYPLPVSIFGKAGVFVLAPQDVDGSELLAGTQFGVPELDRDGYRAISSSPEKMLSMITQDKDIWSDVVQSAMEHLIPSAFYIWPFYVIPHLPTWISKLGRVLVIGDAAHAVPPTLGQGANQAVEDAFSLTFLFSDSRLNSPAKVLKALGSWQKLREDRMDMIMGMTKKMNNNRLPAAEREKLPEDALWKPNLETPGEEMRWLYDVNVEEGIKQVLESVVDEE